MLVLSATLSSHRSRCVVNLRSARALLWKLRFFALSQLSEPSLASLVRVLDEETERGTLCP